MSQERRFRFKFGGAAITKACLYLLFATVGVSLVFLVSGEDAQRSLADWLIATDVSLWEDFRLWQLVTSPLIEPQLISLLFEGFMLWMFLPELERWWGPKRFLFFAGYTSVAAVLVGTLVGSLLAPSSTQVGGVAVAGYAVGGLDSFIFAGIIAYGILFRDRKVQFFGVLPMTGKQLAIGISVFALAFVLIGQQWADGAAMVSAMGVAALIATGKFAPKLWYLKWKQKRVRRHLKIVDKRDDDDDKKKKWVN